MIFQVYTNVIGNVNDLVGSDLLGNIWANWLLVARYVCNVRIMNGTSEFVENLKSRRWIWNKGQFKGHTSQLWVNSTSMALLYTPTFQRHFSTVQHNVPYRFEHYLLTNSVCFTTFSFNKSIVSRPFNYNGDYNLRGFFSESYFIPRSTLFNCTFLIFYKFS